MDLSTGVELSLSAEGLINKDTTSKSDPVCVVHQRNPQTNEFVELGRTEIIQNNLNPVWTTKFALDYRFEERQELKFAIYDWDDKSTSTSDQDYLGCLNCTLGEIISAPNKKFERLLEIPGKKVSATSKLVINSEEIGDNKQSYQMKISARKLDKKDLLGKSDPFLVISKYRDGGDWSKVCTTEVIKKTLDPDWRLIVGKTSVLTGGNPERKLKFQVFDHDNDMKHDLIGEFETSFLELQTRAAQNDAHFKLINPKKQEKKKGYEHSGMLTVESLLMDRSNASFVDFLYNGVQLHFTVAVDFTASNGNPRDVKSLHYMQSAMDNQYVTAIKSVGAIIQDYDHDKLFPALGFGARIPPSDEVLHEFFLNGNPENPFCNGIDGILAAYYEMLPKLRFYGPTYFAPVVNHVRRFAESYNNKQNYFVLLIITDGAICDLDATKEAIVKASYLPLSIIIVGVGDDDFSSMEFLDADNRVLTHQGQTAARDIVQFVEMREFINRHGEDKEKVRQELARKVLQEVPGQVVQYMQSM